MTAWRRRAVMLQPRKYFWLLFLTLLLPADALQRRAAADRRVEL